jgi:hypothetical protein
MLHACFTPIALCFVYTSWRFYAFSGTNLLTRCHSVNSYFLLFLYFRSYIGNILGIGRNKSQSSYLPDMKRESKGEMEEGQEVPAPWGGAAPPLAVPTYGVGPQAPSDIAPPPINSLHRENPRGPNIYPRKVL